MRQLENINLDTLISIIKGKKVACFGAGLQGKRVAEFFSNWEVANHLIAYIDNSDSKIGKKLNSGEGTYPIYSLKQAVEVLPSDLLILISCMDYKTIYEQLEKEVKKDWICIAINEVAEVEFFQTKEMQVIKETENPVIPKKIHYVWIGGEMPLILKKNVEMWKQLCPDYEFYEWNDNNYNIKSVPYMKQAYELKKWAFVSDYIRLDVVYKYGGIYLDTDIEMVKKPDTLLYQHCFGCVDSSLTMNLGSGFGAVPGMEIIRELRDYYNGISFLKEDGSMDFTSCNTYSYQVLKKYGYKINNKLQTVKGMNIYPMIFQGACQFANKKLINDKTFFIHYGNLSWFKNRTK